MSVKKLVSCESFILGESPRIKIILESTLQVGETITITIKSPTNSVVVDAVPMSLVTAKTYQYIYASSSTGVEGKYIATITVTTGEGIDMEIVEFNMVKHP